MTRSYRNPPLALRASVIAVQGALAALATFGVAYAADTDPAVIELTQPLNKAEAGVIYVDKDSAKFGEYNGLKKQVAYLLLNLDVRGGGAYDRESGRTDRWRINGTALGTDARNASGEYAH